MLHHAILGPCPLCHERSLEAHPKLQEAWSEIKLKFPDCHISCSFRNKEDQNECFKKGLSKLQWPKSKHNFMWSNSPCARALDLFRLNSDGKAEFPPNYYSDISFFLVRKLFPIEWSGHWNKMKEMTHFELMDPLPRSYRC